MKNPVSVNHCKEKSHVKVIAKDKNYDQFSCNFVIVIREEM